MPWPKGKKRSVKTRQKMSSAQRLRMQDSEQKSMACENLIDPAKAGRLGGLALKGKAKSTEHREKLAAANRGKKHSEETKRKMREAHARRKAAGINPWAAAHAAENPRGTGRKQSAEERALHSEAMKKHYATQGGKHRPETIEKMKAARAEQKIPFQNTKIEVAVHECLDEIGIDYIKHGRVSEVGYHQFDVKVPSVKLLIEVDGCYWHGCNCIPEERRRTEQRERDRVLTQQARSAGWEILRVWGHEVKSGAAQAMIRAVLTPPVQLAA